MNSYTEPSDAENVSQDLGVSGPMHPSEMLTTYAQNHNGLGNPLPQYYEGGIAPSAQATVGVMSDENSFQAVTSAANLNNQSR